MSEKFFDTLYKNWSTNLQERLSTLDSKLIHKFAKCPLRVMSITLHRLVCNWQRVSCNLLASCQCLCRSLNDQELGDGCIMTLMHAFLMSEHVYTGHL
jgi:hypothetical protein